MERLKSTAVPHLLEPENITGPMVFLASDAASSITAESYNIDSGNYRFWLSGRLVSNFNQFLSLS